MTAPAIEQPRLRDLQCAECGYDLRGLDRAGACPECGTKIELSYRRSRLVFSDPLWVQRIAMGAAFVAGAWMVFIATEALTLAAVFFGTMDAYHVLNPWALSGVGSGLIWIGHWLLASPEPVTGTSRRRALPYALRVLVLVDVSLQFFRLDFFLSHQLAWLMSSLLSAAMLIMLLVILRQLALRLPDEALLKQVSVAVALMVLLRLFGGAAPMVREFPEELDATARLFIVGGAAIYVYAIAVFIRYARRFAATAQVARDQWPRGS